MSGTEKKSQFLNFFDNASARFKPVQKDPRSKPTGTNDKLGYAIDFKLDGGPKHSEIMMVSAMFKDGLCRCSRSSSCHYRAK